MTATHRSGMTYAKFFSSDWRSGCAALTLEEEGLYIRCCAFMYDTGTFIPTSDKEASRLLNVQIQKYTKVMGSLVEKGKMIRAQGWIINDRVQRELDKYRAELAARSLAAQKREASRKEAAIMRVADDLSVKQPPQQPLGQPPQQPPPGSLGGGVGQRHDVPHEVATKKPNEIKEGTITAVSEPYHSCGTNLESRIQKPESNTTTSTVEEADGAGGGDDVLAALNGTAVNLTKFIAKHAKVDEDVARNMLAQNIGFFTSDVMGEAYSLTMADMAERKMIARPYKYLIEVARKLKNGRPRGDRSDRPEPKVTQRQRIQNIVAETTQRIGGDRT